jgi:hypothetical protein
MRKKVERLIDLNQTSSMSVSSTWYFTIKLWEIHRNIEHDDKWGQRYLWQCHIQRTSWASEPLFRSKNWKKKQLTSVETLSGLKSLVPTASIFHQVGSVSKPDNYDLKYNSLTQIVLQSPLFPVSYRFSSQISFFKIRPFFFVTPKLAYVFPSEWELPNQTTANITTLFV